MILTHVHAFSVVEPHLHWRRRRADIDDEQVNDVLPGDEGRHQPLTIAHVCNGIVSGTGFRASQRWPFRIVDQEVTDCCRLLRRGYDMRMFHLLSWSLPCLMSSTFSSGTPYPSAEARFSERIACPPEMSGIQESLGRRTRVAGFIASAYEHCQHRFRLWFYTEVKGVGGKEKPFLLMLSALHLCPASLPSAVSHLDPL